MSTHLDQFRAAMERAGIEPPAAILDDGELHRFPTSGRAGDDSGWYLLHSDGIPAGKFGNWRTGVSHAFRADVGRELTREELEAQRERLARIQADREAERQREHAANAKRAREIWESAEPASDDHPYLKRKGVKSHGLRLHKGALVVPMRIDGTLWSLQFINEAGAKLFLSGGRTGGCYHAIGARTPTLCICEGYATGASIHEATGHAVAIAFSASNLRPVAEGLQAKHPDIQIIIAGDHDASGVGQRAALETAQAVGGAAAIPKGEGMDWNDVAAAEGLEAVRAAIEAAHQASVEGGEPPDARMEGAPADGPAPWPATLDEAAFHGLLGEIVRLIEPQTEADPMAILLQALVAFGATVGRGPHVRVEGDQHHPALFAVIVGESAKARKGTSAGRVKEIFARSKFWPGTVEGLSSGEGLKYHVRDAREEEQFDKRSKKTEAVLVDPGVTDKRLLVVESEFAQALRQTARSGNTLSATVRSAWDTGDLRTLTKCDPIVATGAHICIIGHITIPELRAELTATDTANGFANRFLFALVKRSKLLPFGGEPIERGVLEALGQRIDAAVEYARHLFVIDMSDAARAIWSGVYAELSQGRPGLLGAVTARSEAQALRLALIYALADRSAQIDAPHLLAALAILQYVQASAHYIFGDSLGDPVADELLTALRRRGDGGMTRTDIRDLFGKNQRAERLNAALELLSSRGLARKSDVRTGGRPSEVWRATTKTTNTTKGGAQ